MQRFFIILCFVIFTLNACDNKEDNILNNQNNQNNQNNSNNVNNINNANTNNLNNTNNLLITNETICNDQIDNDGDGQQDCLDSDCINIGDCSDFDVEGICDDHQSNDSDNYIDCIDHDCVGAMYCTGFEAFTDFLIMFPGENTEGGCKNPIALGAHWEDACVGAVVMGNFHLIGNDNLWAVAYYDQDSCNVSSIEDYGIRYEMFQLGFVNAPGGDFVSHDIICYAHCGPDWEGNHANVNISCFFRADAEFLFDDFNEDIQHRDEVVELDMTKVIFRTLVRKN